MKSQQTAPTKAKAAKIAAMKKIKAAYDQANKAGLVKVTRVQAR